MRRSKSRRPSANVIKAKRAAVLRRKTQREVAVAMGSIAAQVIKDAMVPGHARGPVVPEAGAPGSTTWYQNTDRKWVPPSDAYPTGKVQKIVKAAVDLDRLDFRGMMPEQGERLAAQLLPIIEKNNLAIRKLAAIVEVVKATGSIGAAREALEEMAAEGNPLFLSDGRLNPEWVDDL